MPGETLMERQEGNISVHIFAVSAAMVGVCITVISLLNINEALRAIENKGDELLTVSALMFLSSCLISYLAIRTKDRKSRLVIERTADWIFMGAIIMLALVALFIGWELL